MIGLGKIFNTLGEKLAVFIEYKKEILRLTASG
jgi:hypothetical protein